MFDLEIINADVVTACQTYRGCISIQAGKIAAISQSPLRQARRTIDAAGLTLVPGMVDQHVHFMDPSHTEREDFIHGTSAAAVAGVTTVIEHTHSQPIRSVGVLDERISCRPAPSYRIRRPPWRQHAVGRARRSTLDPERKSFVVPTLRSEH